MPNEKGNLSPKTRLGFSQTMILAWLLACVSCLLGQNGRNESLSGQACPPSAFDYGSGMAAATLPESVIEAMRRSREQVLAFAGRRQAMPLLDQPWEPHISIVYGVRAPQARPVARRLEAFQASAAAVSGCLSKLHYWEDQHAQKTILVVDVEEPSGVLTSLHDELTEVTKNRPQFSYQPHVTLAYLRNGTRFDDKEEAAIYAPLRGQCWRIEKFYITDRCGRKVRTIP